MERCFLEMINTMRQWNSSLISHVSVTELLGNSATTVAEGKFIKVQHRSQEFFRKNDTSRLLERLNIIMHIFIKDIFKTVIHSLSSV